MLGADGRGGGGGGSGGSVRTRAGGPRPLRRRSRDRATCPLRSEASPPPTTVAGRRWPACCSATRMANGSGNPTAGRGLVRPRPAPAGGRARLRRAGLGGGRRHGLRCRRPGPAAGRRRARARPRPALRRRQPRDEGAGRRRARPCAGRPGGRGHGAARRGDGAGLRTGRRRRPPRAKSVCSFFTACYHAADFERAASWTELFRRQGLIGPDRATQLFLSGHCDSVQATLLVELGRWSEAEAS